MASIDVVVREGDAIARYPIPESGLTVGRGDECDIVLNSRHASRVHARIWLEAGAVHLQDLGSRNGVEVNGARVESCVLGEADKVRIAGAEIAIARGTESGFGRAAISREQASALQQSIMRDAGDARLLVLYDAAKLLGEVFDLDELLDKILALIFQALPVRRGFILTARESDRAPEVRASRMLEAGESGLPLSHTLIEHVFANAEAILTLDAQADSRFGQAESIMGHDIHAAMCAPLHGRAAVAGAIYVDTGNTASPLTERDLELLSAIAQVVGVAVENARLYRENVERERLAALGMATAGLGHCIKNILTGIRGGAQLVNMAIEKQELRYLNRGWPILRGAMARIDMLVMNMLVFSRDREPERIATDINALIHDVIALFEERAARYKVGIAFEPDPVGMATVDPQAIYRVLANLVVNAVEACEHNGGAIEIACVCAEGGCTIRVRDTGIGIPAELLPQVFQAFVSGKGSSGTGLGLACSYKIVREHGGDIQVRSDPGSGTVFTVFLPEGNAEPPAQRKTTIQRRQREDNASVE
ncbi:MAG: FHA domain-containing protein [Candidatus Hydrogenedentes bacterium]|nr:FHA domain-containing protein [Candidatus Hydrogenedentota bacterium]